MKKQLKEILKQKFLLGFILVLFVLIIGWDFVGYFQTDYWAKKVKTALDTIFFISLFYLVFSVTQSILRDASKKTKRRRSKATLTGVENILTVVFYSVIVFYSLGAFGVDVSGLIAAGGIAGLAFGLAAREFLANLFGGIAIILDQPFVEKEWISSPDRNIEGTVKKINLRITEITTFDNRPLYVPNATFLSIIIENPSRMNNRRICEKFGIRYRDSEQVKKIVKSIEKYLAEHDEIDANQTIMVNLVNFASSSLECQVYCFTKTTDWKLYRNIKQDVMLHIVQIIKDHHADIALPTRTIKSDEGSETIKWSD